MYTIIVDICNLWRLFLIQRVIEIKEVLAIPKIGTYPCNRFNQIQSAFKGAQRQTITKERVKTLLDQTHQEGQYPTVYSYIFDLKTLQVTLFPNHRYSEGKTYWLPRELKKDGHRIPINLY